MSGAVLELDIVSIVGIKVELLEKFEIIGCTEPHWNSFTSDQYRPVVECALSDEHKLLMGVDTVWVDMEGLAADDANEHLLESHILG